ncbi:MAG: FAD-dependent oxidoreductase [Tetrasphaera sp.]|nr:FAD-dependent oxidoreductase [Tetrasphaera sp.]
MPQTPLGEDVTPARAAAALTGARQHSYWTDWDYRGLPEPSLRAPLRPGAGRADLVIVGGGFTGLWAAIQAKEADPARSVVLLESGRVGEAASGRNGGFVSPSLTHGLAQGLACWPEEIDTLERLGAENYAGWKASLTTYGIDCGFHEPGELTIALTEHQVERVREGYESARAHGHEVELLDATQVRARVDSPRYLLAHRDPHIGLVDPGLLVRGLADAAERLGVVVHEHSPVTAFETVGAGLRVTCGDASIDAEGVILGTGAFRGPLKRLAIYTLPVYDHVLMTEPLTAEQLAAIGWAGREGLTDAGNQFHYYRRTLDDRVLFGGYDANYHFPGRISPTLEQSASHDLLARHLISIFPALAEVRFTHRWAGVIDTTSRFTPIFGTAFGGRLAYAVGYTGLGVGSTRFGAAVALDLLAGVPTERTELAMVRELPMPFPPEPIRYAVVRATRSALAAEDRTGRRGLWLKVLDRMGIGFDT